MLAMMALYDSTKSSAATSYIIPRFESLKALESLTPSLVFMALSTTGGNSS